MTDLLDADDVVVGRNRHVRNQGRESENKAPPNPASPKELAIAVRAFLGSEWVSTNLSRAVIKSIQDSAPSCEVAAELDLRRLQVIFLPATLEALEDECDALEQPLVFLRNVKRLDKRERLDTALDLIFDQVDELLLSGAFDEVDQILGHVVPDEFSTEVLVGLLTVTLPAKNQLARRDEFFQRVAETLRTRGETDQRILIGLD